MRSIILLAASHKAHSSIIATDGHLRMLDPKSPRCMSYSNACTCTECSSRANKHGNKAVFCSCQNPHRLEGRCVKCGRATHKQIAA